VAFERYLPSEDLIDEIHNKYFDLSHIIYQLGGTTRENMTSEFACKQKASEFFKYAKK